MMKKEYVCLSILKRMKVFKKIFNFGSKKEEKIEWWSDIEGLPGVVPIETSSNFIPKWWTNMPMWQNDDVKEANTKNNIVNKGTVRRCPAIPEFMGMGFTVPLWCDLEVNIFDDGGYKWNTPSGTFTFGNHGASQLGDWVPKHSSPTLILKPNCPWRVRTPPGVSMLQLPMFWHFNPNFTVAPGVIWTDIHHEINQQMMFHKKGRIRLERGTPLAQYIPIRRETIPHAVTNETPELRAARNTSFFHVRTKFGGGYPQHRKETIKKGECPYHATTK